MNCNICSSKTNLIFKAKIMAKHEIEYFHCVNCNFIQTEKPYWLKEAYGNPINLTDTGIISRNLNFSYILETIFIHFFKYENKYLDYAGGYGIFTRIMRDKGFDFYWRDPFCQNLLAKQFEQEGDIKYEAITCFECLEHLENPMLEIEKLLKLSDNLIFSTETLPNQIPKPENWWYYGLDHGQHISFYSPKTMQIIATRFNKNYFNINSLHVFSDIKINKLKLKILYKFKKFGAYKNLQSKTYSDMLYLKNINEKNI